MLIRKSAAKMTGATLLETMFALAVGAFVLIAAVVLYKSIRLNSNVSEVMSDMNTIRLGYKNYLASGYKFNAKTDELQLTAVQTAGFLPSPLNDPWGLPYVVSLTWYTGYISIAIPGLDTTTKGAEINDARCNAIWVAAQVTGALSVPPGGTVTYNCAFRYRFP